MHFPWLRQTVSFLHSEISIFGSKYVSRGGSIFPKSSVIRSSCIAVETKSISLFRVVRSMRDNLSKDSRFSCALIEMVVVL